MQPADSLPSYEQLFGELDFREQDESRSVYSPAAYLAELIQLLGNDAPAGLLGDLLSRRPAIGNVPLDGANTYTELPYLDVVNEVLEQELTRGRTVGADQVLRALRHPFTMPFSLRHERLRRLLHHLQVEPAELYRHLADTPAPDVVAREYLGLTPDDVKVLTTPLGDGPVLREHWGLDADAEENLRTLEAVPRFRQAASLTGAELRELLYGGLGAASTGGTPPERSAASALFVHHGGPVVVLDPGEERLVCADDPADPYDDGEPIPAAWFDRVSRFVRLARRTGLTLTDLDLVLRDCCGNRIDARALRHLAVLLHLHRGLDVPIDVAVSLVAPMNTLGAGDGETPRDLFDRVFNVPFATAGAPVILGSARVPHGYAGRPVLACAGDVLATRNRDYRRRVTAALSLTEDELAALVTRFRERSTPDDTAQPLPFDRATGPAELSLLHRIHRFSAALGVSAEELLDVLDALESDPALRRHTTFPLLIDTGAGTGDHHAVLAGGDVASGLWLAQTLLAVVPWMRSADLTGRELATVLGAAAARAEAGGRGGPGARAGLNGQAVPGGWEEPDADAALLAELRRRFEELAPSPGLFVSPRFGPRAAAVIHDIAVAHPDGVVSRRDARLLRVEAAHAAAAAYNALTELDMVVGGDLEGIGLGDRLAVKVYTNLVIAGHLEPGGALVADRLPDTPARLRLARDFGGYRDALFGLLRDLCPVPGPGQQLPDPAVFFPSDLAKLADLDDAGRAELYDNLIFNGHLDDAGTVLRPGFFALPHNRAAFTVNADLSGVAAAVHARLGELAARFTGGAVAFDPAVLAALPLSPRQVTALVESLRFNGHLDAGGFFADPAALLDPGLGELALALEFYPHRRHVLDLLRGRLTRARAELLAVTPADFLDITDPAAAQRAADLLDGAHLADDRVLQGSKAFFADPANRLELAGFTAAENSAIFQRIATALADHRPYRVDPAASAEFGFDPGERAQLVARLVNAGHLTPELGVPEHRLGYFAEVYNALDFVLPGLEDFAKDVFFLLHAVAVRTNAAIAEITARLEALAARQGAALLAVLQDELGASAPVTAAACAAVTGGAGAAVELLAAPALAGAGRGADLPPDSRAALRRIRAVALLAGKFGLDADQIVLAFRDQDLAGKFPEPLAAPRGVDRIDALLESSDGNVYLFLDRECWVYGPGYVRTGEEAVPLATLSARFADLAGVDAAFSDVTGTDWIIGRDTGGVARTFTRQRGGARWAPDQREWGVVENSFDAPAAIDAAFTDEEGRVYLFCGDQYVRYSGTGREHVDPGHPRRIAGWWQDRQHGHRDQHSQHSQPGLHGAELPERFRRSLDAAFRGTDDTTYLFSGDRFLAVEGASDAADGPLDGIAAERPVAEVWGRIRNAFAETGRIDAACADGAAYLIFSGDQVFRYSGDVEGTVGGDAEGTVGGGEPRADAGFPQLIEAFLPEAPAEFTGGLEAAFRDTAGVLHLFKNGRTVALRPDGPDIAPTAQRWGTLGAALPGGTVDAAFVGLDGRTYLFSGDRYLRYSGADYSTVDPGYPRRVADDWGGLLRVDAAFTLGGATHLFGTAGLITTLPLEHAADLDAGRLPHPVRRLLLEHGIAAAEDAPVSGTGPEWHLTADHGIRLALRRAADPAAVDPVTGRRAFGERIEVRYAAGGEEADASFHVRYSTRDYTVPDAAHPQALAAGRWNLPDALADAPFTRVDAAFTGRDGLMYLFSGDHYATFDNKHRWWSEPQPLRRRWDDLPFDRVDAALLGKDGRTYLFSGTRYVRCSTGDHTRIDDRHPATITRFWGNVVNAIARTGRVDATLVADDTGADGVVRTRTYLFSGNQYVRYTGTDLSTPDLGYPQVLAALPREPRLAGLKEAPAALDAAFADLGTVYLFGGGQCQAISQSAYRRYGDALAEPVGCAFEQDGSPLAEHGDGWYLHGQPEREAVAPRRARPRFPRAVPPEFRADLDAVLHGADGNTYLFKGASCFDARLGRAYPLAEEWGRSRNNVYHDNAVDAAFVGTDGRTYLFSGDQFVAYDGAAAMDADVEGAPLPIAAHWGGLTRVTLAYVRDATTYLFEPPRPDGTMRYVTYTGRDYTRAPQGGVPRIADAGFWGVPEEHLPAGFTVPDAVLSVGESTLLLFDGLYVRRDPAAPAGATTGGPVTAPAGAWSQPRPLERAWRGLAKADGLTSAFVGRDGATYFFFPGEFARHDGTLAARRPIRDAWGRTRNNFLGTGDDVVDAAFADTSADGSRVTYLFSGDQYVRYTGTSYRHADPGYPRPIAGNLRAEEAFTGLPVSFDEDLADRLETSGRSMIDAVTGSGRTVRILSGTVCHVLSRGLSARFDQTALARVRNTVAERRRVDAALVIGGAAGGEGGPRTLLFSGDQYVRYTGTGGYDQVDEGHPRSIAEALPAELGIAELPESFRDAIDAAFQDADGAVYLFAGPRYLRVHDGQVSEAPIAGAWGVVDNAFRRPGASVEAAFTSRDGDLYVFCGGQYARYRMTRLKTVEDGYPRPVAGDWGNLPEAFDAGPDAAFSFEGRAYLCRDTEHVRYSGDRYDTPDRTYPQPWRHRWSGTADFRLSDVRTIARFAELARAHPGDLAAFLLPGEAAVEDPYRYLAGLFGWDADEIRWCRRRVGLLTDGAADESLFELEFLIRIAGLFAFTARLGTVPSALHADVWSRLYADGGDQALDAAAEALRELLIGRGDPADRPALRRVLHDELNVLRRDALVAAVLARGPGDGLRTPRDLFDRLLIDVEMGPRGTTSRVREAIAAVQLYVHRYLLSLETPAIAVANGSAGVVEPAEEVRRRIREWWQWMRGYRLWEANRKVFLYPENYLRPELRADRTPAFRALEGDLLQNEITAATVEHAYKRYLDEYTEVSRLTIAGGYVYTKDRAADGPYRLALFGRTKTDPRRYYHRRAEFASRDRLSASWEPWQKVGLQIDADQVHPVHAFGRMFVFWAAVEPVADDAATTTVVAESKGDGQQVSGKPPTRQIKIFYSFENLNKEWVAAQTLGVGAPRSGTLDGVTLVIQPVADGEDRTSVVVACAYTVTTPNPPDKDGKPRDPTVRRTGLMFSLSPELVAEDLTERALADIPGISGLPFGIFHGPVLEVLAGAWVAGETDDKVAQALAAAAGRVAEVFVDPVRPVDVVRFDTPVAAESGSWFSVDVKGGSFLCRPADTGPDDSAGLLPLEGNDDGLPPWAQVDAAVELPGGARYFFDNTTGQYAESVPGKVPDGAPAGTPAGALSGRLATASRWGLVPTVLPRADKVDTVLTRGPHTFVFSGQRYVRFTGVPFQVVDEGYPKNIKTNRDGLPPWTKVDVAFTTPDGVEYFLSYGLGRYMTSEDIAAGAAKNPPEAPADHRLEDLSVFENLPGTFKPLDAVLVNGHFAFAFAGDFYARYTWRTDSNGHGRGQGGQRRRRFVLDELEGQSRYPQPLAGNRAGLPQTRVNAAAWREDVTYFFDNGDNGTAGGTGSGFYRKITSGGTATRHRISATTLLASTGKAGAAYTGDGKLYLTSGTEYVRYTLGDDGLPGRLVDPGYPRPLTREINTAFTRAGKVYLFSGAAYARAATGRGPDEAGEYLPVAGAWGGLPRESPTPFDAAMDSGEGLFLFAGAFYVRRARTAAVPRPYERTSLPFEIIRLTTGTAAALNQRLLSGGVAALLDTATQESDEVAVTTDPEATAAVRVREDTVDEGRLPTGAHLDFQSANGVYYWEIFFHAPLLIAQALNEAQRFEDAKRWYEYVFDPTNPRGHWRFLPFLGADLRALADGCARDLEVLRELGVPATTVEDAGLPDVLAALRRLAAADTGDGKPRESDLLTVTADDTHLAIAAAVTTLAATTGLTTGQAAAVTALGERTAVLADLEKQLRALGGRADLLRAYRDDPFDPHAIARLRPVAYRRAVVMGYIDNLLDWGDMLFRQYTPESVDEARMLYILAYDLLGDAPERLDTALPPKTRTFTDLDREPGDLDLLGHLTGGGSLLEQAGQVHASVADSYFHIPDNSLFAEYWERVVDRLRKIRDSLNILGVSQPLPLFEPPLDPMRLVRAAATGIPLGEAAAAATTVPVPPQRFPVALRRAQELTDRVRQFGADLLGVLERRDAEELNLLQVRQEGTILGLTLAARRAQVRIAEEDLAELRESLASAKGRSDHYGGLIDGGLSPLEHGQLAMMSTGAALHVVAAILKTGAAFAYPAPQVKAGPFILGTEWGGEQVGRGLDKAGEVAESSAEGLSMIGEALGVRAQHERSVEDWRLQRAIAGSDMLQIGHQITAANHRLEAARQELRVLEQEIVHNTSAATFMRDKFTGAELYGWLSARLSGLCFQAYELAYDAARAAEAAYRFERGVRDGEPELIRPAYWESRRSGLQAAESLGMDLERLGQAHATGNTRGLEITKKVSLLELDPVALLRLRSGGRCEFTLGEDLFGRDFPGHFLRQIRTVSVTFADAAGEPLGLNATLTQLTSKTVLEADPKAVKYLLDPQGEAPATLRGDWRPGQRIALSQAEYPQENNGLFELRYDDERYLPFEGTGAVSTWRLELGGGPRGATAARALTDVTLTVRYTAEHGGDVFTEAVKGMLRPYPAAHLIDVARDFPKEWAAFLDGGDPLVLPLSPDLFPAMSSRRITGLYARYEYAGEGTARLVLETGRRLPLADGVPLTTPGLSLNGGGPSPWAFTAEGDRSALGNVTLVLTYQAAVR
ncbi:hemopexin repeat-containing protein [Streptosporangium sp. V21-05]|uniref:hemopexin repeat-containing protein n=1 Tax=Streptosporangium sp. V21-05 TaxID=3446115 RepID=UPI003F52A15B